MSREAGYGRTAVDMLDAARIRGVQLSIEASNWIAAWLRESLTDAALDGCHHCGEREPREPCWWCWLKTEDRQ